jgi:arginyl-tRNA synthetase
MNVFHQINRDLLSLVSKLFDSDLNKSGIIFTPEHGEISTNIAFTLAKIVDRPVFEIASLLSKELEKLHYVQKVQVATPGFINLFLHIDFWHQHLLKIVQGSKEYMFPDVGKGKKVNLEYVSVNPTGPLHIGHARLAVYGDVLANLLSKCGYNVVKEFYINDYGSQVHNLVATIKIRYGNIVTGKEEEIPDGLYPGEYLIPVAKALHAKYGSDLLSLEGSDTIIRDFTLEAMMQIIRQDLSLLNVVHDVFVSEALIQQKGKIKEIVQSLIDKDLVYEGYLPRPQGYDSVKANESSHLLFRSTKFGDSQDRSLQKDDGDWSYFGSELAYTQDKIDRGFDIIVVLLGADHAGYVERLKAAIEALSEGKITSQVKVCQLVKYLEDGLSVSMSKRQGNFVTLKSLIEDVGHDVVRFMMISKKNDVPMDFDLVKIKEHSRDNPVFYVHYAHARAQSVLRKAQDLCPEAIKILEGPSLNLNPLIQKEEIALIRKFSEWPKIVTDVALSGEVHRIVFYLQEIAVSFHSLWDLCGTENSYRFIVRENINLTASRLLLVKGMISILNQGFSVIGINPMNVM